MSRRLYASVLVLTTLFMTFTTNTVSSAKENKIINIKATASSLVKTGYSDARNSMAGFAAASKMGDGTQTLSSATIVNQSEFSENAVDTRRLFLEFDLSDIADEQIENASLKFNAKFNGQAAGNINAYVFGADFAENVSSIAAQYATEEDLLSVDHEKAGNLLKSEGSVNNASWFSMDISDYMKHNAEIIKFFIMIDYVPVKYNSAYSMVVAMTDEYMPYIVVEPVDITNPVKPIKFDREVGFYESDGTIGIFANSTLYSLGSNNSKGDAQLILSAKLDEVPYERLLGAKLKVTSNYQGNDGGTLRIFDCTDMSFENTDDFVANYSDAAAINKEIFIGSLKASGVSGKYIQREIDITEQIFAKESYGRISFLLDYIPFTQNPAYICNTNGILAQAGYPYIELTLDVPPKAENVRIEGDYVENESLTLYYDYISDHEETETEIRWYKADIEGDSYKNEELIAEGQKTVELKSDTVGKYIYAEVIPVCADGFYTKGSPAISEPCQNAVTAVSEIDAVLKKLYSAGSQEDFFDTVVENNQIFKVETDLSEYSDAEKENICRLIKSVFPDSFTKFRREYKRALVIEKINKAESTEAIDGLINDQELGLSLEGYNKIKDKNTICSQYYHKDIQSMVGFDDEFNKHTAYYMLKESDRTNVSEYLLYNDFVLTADIKELNQSQLSNLGVRLLKKTYNDFSTLDKAVSDLISEIRSGNSGSSSSSASSGSSGGGGGGGGGGGSTGVSAKAPHIASVEIPASSETKTSDRVPIKVLNNEQGLSFSDLDSTEWAREAIEELASKGVINGYDDGTFKPLDHVTREQFVKMLVLAYGLTTTGAVRFEDVPDDAWYADYIAIAYNNRIVRGISDTEFGVGNLITRQDMAVMIYNAALLSPEANSGDNRFNDDADISGYAKSAVYQLSNAGIINGVGNNKFAPKDYANRAMAAVIIYRAISPRSDHYSGKLFGTYEIELTTDLDIESTMEEIDRAEAEAVNTDEVEDEFEQLKDDETEETEETEEDVEDTDGGK